MTARTSRPHVNVVMAVFRPDLVLLNRALASIRRQEGVGVTIHAVVDGHELGSSDPIDCLRDAGAQVHLSAERLGTRAAFALGLRHALERPCPGGPGLFAFADQDDIWHAEKLARLTRELEARRVSLVHCDARVVSPEGQVIAPSLHRYEAREPAVTLRDHVLLNAVSGMTAVFTEDAARLALRLMDDLQSGILHDHVTAIAAAASAGTMWLDQPLVDYLQHGRNYLGARPVSGAREPWSETYRAASRAIFADRRAVVMALAREGVYDTGLARMFGIGAGAGTFRLSAANLLAAAHYGARGQRRRSHLCLRLLDGAWQSAGTTAGRP